MAEFVYNRGSVSEMKTEKTKETGEQKMKAYDYVVVGAGLYGAVFAREAVKKGKKVLVIEQTPKHRGKCIYGEWKGFMYINTVPYFPYQQ